MHATESARSTAKPRSLRRELIALIVFALVPMLVFSLIVALWGAWLQARSVESGVRNTTSALALAVSREVESWKATLRAAATSRMIDEGDYTAFHHRLAPLVLDYDAWFSLVAADGTARVNTAVPPDLPQPPVAHGKWIMRVVETGKPMLTDLYFDAVRNSPVVTLHMPVVRGGAVTHVLSMTLRPQRLDALLEAQTLPNEWRAMLLDGEQRVIAQSSPTYMVGALPPQWVVARDPRGSVVEGNGADGRLELVSYDRLTEADWTVAVAVPRAAIDRDSALILMAMTAGGVALLALAVWLSGRVASRIEEPIRSLARRAEHGFSEAGQTVDSGVRELQDLERAFARAAEVQRERAAEREQLLSLEVANRAKDEFLATLSHELRTPLQAALGWLHVLRLGGQQSAPQQQAAHDKAIPVIERNLRQLAQLVDDLIDASRIVAGKVTLRPESLDLARLVQQMVETWQPALAKKNLQLQLALTPDTWVHADRARMAQVLSNLVANAVKFTPTGGRIDVRLERRDASAVLCVADTGAGIDSHALPLVFDKFWQADGGSERRYQGLGLGLAIVRSLVELQGGRVTADSAGAGSGALFTVILPAIAAPRSVEAAPVRAAERPLRGQRLLVVDDDVDAGGAIAQMLQLNGAEIRLVHTVQQALGELSQDGFQALLTDIAMPGEDGFDLLRAVRLRGRGLPVIAVTAFAADNDRERIAAAGFDGVVTKPVQIDDLVALLLRLTAATS